MTQFETVTATWASRYVYEILERVAAGETFVVTRYEKQVATIVPHERATLQTQDNEATQEFLERIRSQLGQESGRSQREAQMEADT